MVCNVAGRCPLSGGNTGVGKGCGIAVGCGVCGGGGQGTSVGQPGGGGTVGVALGIAVAVLCGFSGKGTGVPSGDICPSRSAVGEGGGARGETRNCHSPRLGNAPLINPRPMSSTTSASMLNRMLMGLLVCFTFRSFRFGYAPCNRHFYQL